MAIDALAMRRGHEGRIMRALIRVSLVFVIVCMGFSGDIPTTQTSDSPSSTSQPAPELDYAVRLRWIRGRATQLELHRDLESLCKRLDFEAIQCNQAFKLLPSVTQEFSAVWNLRTYDVIDSDVYLNWRLVAHPDFEAALADLRLQVQTKVQSLATNDQIIECSRLESSQSNREQVFAAHARSLCEPSLQAEWPSEECNEYLWMHAEETSRLWGRHLRMNRAQRLKLRDALRELVSTFAAENRDVLCPLYQSFPCEKPDDTTLSDPQFCRLFIPVMKRLYDSYDDMETQVSAFLSASQRTEFSELMEACRSGNKAYITKLRSVIRSASQASKAASSEPASNHP